MKVNFDGLRKNIANSYTRLISDYQQIVRELDVVNEDNNLLFDLKSDLDEMRKTVAALLYCYDEESIKKENDCHNLEEVANKLPYTEFL